MNYFLGPLTSDEWEELCSLRRAINDGPSSVAPHKMERFSELFVRTLYGKGDSICPEHDSMNGAA